MSTSSTFRVFVSAVSSEFARARSSLAVIPRPRPGSQGPGRFPPGGRRRHPVAQAIALPYPSLGPLFKGREEFLAQLRARLARFAGHAYGPCGQGAARTGRRGQDPAGRRVRLAASRRLYALMLQATGRVSRLLNLLGLDGGHSPAGERSHEFMDSPDLQKGPLGEILEAFQAADVEAPRDKLLACGNAFLEEGRPWDAVRVFQALGDADRLRLRGRVPGEGLARVRTGRLQGRRGQGATAVVRRSVPRQGLAPWRSAGVPGRRGRTAAQQAPRLLPGSPDDDP